MTTNPYAPLILILDDDEDDVVIAKGYLESVEPGRYRCVHAPSLEQARTLFETEVPALCLVDYALGVARGTDFVGWVSQYFPGLPCILLTGMDEQAIDKEGLEAGAVSYLNKNQMTPEALERAVRYALGSAASIHELNQDARLLETVVSALSEVFWIYDLQTEQMTYVSPGVERLFGHGTGTALEASCFWIDFAAQEDRNRVRAAWQVARKSGHLDIKYRLRGEDGAAHWVHLRGRPVDTGSHRVLNGLCTDVTREMVESSRRQLLEASVASIAEGVIILDEGAESPLRVAYANEAAERMAAVPDGALEGKAWAEIAGTLTGGKLTEQQLRHLDGTRCHGSADDCCSKGRCVLEWAATRLSGEGAGRGHIVVVLHNITESAEAKRTLRKQASMLDNSNDAIALWNPRDGITYWNRAAEKLYGRTADEVIGQPALEVFRPDAKAWNEAFAEVCAKGEWQGELTCQGPRKQAMIMQNGWTLLEDEAGGTPSVLSIQIDVTTRRQMEQRMQRSQRLENLGNLASGVAHDLNNILMPIMVFCELIREDIESPEKRRYLDQMERSIERASGVVSQLLAFARGRNTERVVQDLGAIVRELGEVCQETFPRSLDIKVEAPREARLVVADRTQLEQVLMNLCVNARDAMEGLGSLTLTLRDAHLDANQASMLGSDKEGDYHVVEIRDTGCGIPKEMRDSVFEPFVTTKDQGTGLGLSIVRDMVAKHDGMVELVSAEDAGTTVSIYLPVAVGEEEPGHRDSDLAELEGLGENVLIVDDEKAVSASLALSLAEHGYTTLEAGSVPRAVTIIAQRDPAIDVVISDIQMPEMNGLNGFRVMREIEPTLPCIAISGNLRPEQARRLTEMGIPCQLEKPFGTVTILRALKQVLQEAEAAGDEPVETSGRDHSAVNGRFMLVPKT